MGQKSLEERQAEMRDRLVRQKAGSNWRTNRRRCCEAHSSRTTASSAANSELEYGACKHHRT